MVFNENKMDWVMNEGLEIVERISESSRSRSNMKKYNRLKYSLGKTILYNANLKSEIYYFGSRLSGVSTSFSDLDLYVDVGKYVFIINLLRKYQFNQFRKFLHGDVRFRTI